MTIEDSKGRRWLMSIDVDALARVRKLAGVDLLTLIEPDSDLHARLQFDLVLTTDVLHAVMRPQADRNRLSASDFADAFDGDGIERATVALLTALVEFLPAVDDDPDDAKPDEKETPEANKLVTAAAVWQACFEFAGRVGVAPGSFTMRELKWMADGRGRDEWNRTAALMATLINSNPFRAKDAKVIHPWELNPYTPAKEHAARRPKDDPIIVPLSALQGLFFPAPKPANPTPPAGSL